MKTYKAILFHPEGDFVTDFQRDSIEDVWREIENMGSRWIFYPIVFVATEKTIVDCPEGLEHLKRKRIKTVKKHIRSVWKNEDKDRICWVINEGAPLHLIY